MTGGECEPKQAAIQIVITISGHPRLILIRGSCFQWDLPVTPTENAGIIRAAVSKIKSND
jgi:hypothetical protein